MYYFLSDLHLRRENSTSAQVFLKFLKTLNANNTKAIYLLGDIFDLWVADHEVFIKKYENIIQELKRLKNENIAIHYFEGNHDLYLKKFWQGQLGFLVHEGPAYFYLDGLQIRMEHGDQTNPEDRSYLRFRRFLRTAFMRWIFHKSPGTWLEGLGKFASEKSREQESKYPWDVKSVLRSHIERLLKKEDFDVLISGHMHERLDEDLDINGKKVRNINLGWWGDGKKVLKLSNKNFSWMDLEQEPASKNEY